MHKDSETGELRKAIERRDAIEGQLQRRLEEYEREHQAMKSVVGQLMDIVRSFDDQKTKKQDEDIGPEAIPVEQPDTIRDGKENDAGVSDDPAPIAGLVEAQPPVSPTSPPVMVVEASAPTSSDQSLVKSPGHS